MSTVGDAATGLKRIAQGLVGSSSRDQLVEERDGLLAAIPPAPAGMSGPPTAPPACGCPHCTDAAQEAQAARVRRAAWEGRVAELERGLSTLTWGGLTKDKKDPRDAPGKALATLCDDLLRAFEVNRMRPWERIVTTDDRGRATATDTTEAQAELARELLSLYRSAKGPWAFLGTDDLMAAIAEARARKDAALAMPLERPIDPEDARRAGLTTRPTTDESNGLTPGPSPNVLEGSTVRFTRKGGR